jgi:predicted Zn-dependent protease
MLRGELELRKKDPKAAVVSLQRLAELEPQDASVRNDLAVAQRQAGDLQGAVATIAEARKLDPSNIALAGQEVMILGQRNPDDGIAAAQRLGAQMPDQPVAQAAEGDFLMTLKRPADATAAYQRAFQAHPSLFLAERLASGALRDGKPAEAGKILKDWLAAHPTDIAARISVANFVLSQKDWADAKARYEGIMKDAPNDVVVMNNLAVIYQRDGDARALDLAQRARIAAPRSAAIADTLGWIMVQKDDAANGIKFLEQAHAGTPDDLDVQYHLAFALDRTGKKADAVDLLKKAIGAGRDFDSKKEAESLLAQLSKS